MKFEDLMLLILTITICVGLMIAVSQPYLTGVELSEQRAQNIGVIVGALVAMISRRIGPRD